MRVSLLLSSKLTSNSHISTISIVEYSNPEDAQRSIKELSEVALLSRPVYIREVCVLVMLNINRTLTLIQDRENSSRFGATPVPGKIGMAMAGQGLNAGPPPRPASHNYLGAGSGANPNNPGNQLYVGNVCLVILDTYLV